MTRVYGPYKRSDGREHVILIDGEHRRTVSYPKYLMEQKLGRELDPDEETINHKNGDFTDNRWENLEIIPRAEHSSKDGIRLSKVKTELFICPICNKTFKKRIDSSFRANRKSGKAGPFCSKECVGVYGKNIQIQAPYPNRQRKRP